MGKEIDRFIKFWSRGAPEKCVEEVTEALGNAHALAEFSKYRIVQDRLFMSDYDRFLIELENEAKKNKEEGKNNDEEK